MQSHHTNQDFFYGFIDNFISINGCSNTNGQCKSFSKYSGSTEGTGEATSSAICDQGDSALSGSYGIANTTDFVTDRISETRDGWVTTVSGPSMGNDVVIIRTFVNCFNNPPLRQALNLYIFYYFIIIIDIY